MNDSRSELRRRVQSARASLSATEQAAAAESVRRRVVDHVEELVRSGGEAGFATGRIVAGYVAAHGELDPLPTMLSLVDSGWTIALPVCGPDAQMDFCSWQPGDPLVENRYGIGEPVSAPLASRDIGLVLVPGVGFSESLSRIGHGVGYYDRWFARCFDADHHPYRLGMAHDLQIVDLPPDEPWDVSMQTIVTPTRVLT